MLSLSKYNFTSAGIFWLISKVLHCTLHKGQKLVELARHDSHKTWLQLVIENFRLISCWISKHKLQYIMIDILNSFRMFNDNCEAVIRAIDKFSFLLASLVVLV